MNIVEQICNTGQWCDNNLDTNTIFRQVVLMDNPAVFDKLVYSAKFNNIQYCKKSLVILAMSEGKKKIVEYFIKDSCSKSKTDCIPLLQTSYGALLLIHNKWFDLYKRFSLHCTFEEMDFKYALSSILEYDNTNMLECTSMLEFMLKNGANNMWFTKYMYIILPGLVQQNKPDMLKVLLKGLQGELVCTNKLIEQPIDRIVIEKPFVDQLIKKAIEADNIDSLESIMFYKIKLYMPEEKALNNHVDEYTPIQWSVIFNSKNCIIYLLNKNIDFHKVSINNQNTLDILNQYQYQSNDLLEIIPNHILVNSKQHVEDLLHIASWTGNLDMINYLIQNNKVDINARDKHNLTPLCQIFGTPVKFYNRLQCMQLLITAGATFDTVPFDLMIKGFFEYDKDVLEQLLYIHTNDAIKYIHGIDYYNFRQEFKTSVIPLDIVRYIASFLDKPILHAKYATALIGQVDEKSDVLNKYIYFYNQMSI